MAHLIQFNYLDSWVLSNATDSLTDRLLLENSFHLNSNNGIQADSFQKNDQADNLLENIRTVVD